MLIKIIEISLYISVICLMICSGLLYISPTPSAWLIKTTIHCLVNIGVLYYLYKTEGKPTKFSEKVVKSYT